MHKSLDILTNNATSHGDELQLVVRCYVEVILNGAVEKVQEDMKDDQSIDFYFIIHSHPIPSPCQKFMCDNTDEINLVYHCWLFQDVPYDLEENFTDQLDMGVFEPHGVQPVHQNLQDSGIEFGGISERQETPSLYYCICAFLTELCVYMVENFHQKMPSCSSNTTVTCTLFIVWQNVRLEELLSPST